MIRQLKLILMATMIFSLSNAFADSNKFIQITKDSFENKLNDYKLDLLEVSPSGKFGLVLATHKTIKTTLDKEVHIYYVASTITHSVFSAANNYSKSFVGSISGGGPGFGGGHGRGRSIFRYKDEFLDLQPHNFYFVQDPRTGYEYLKNDQLSTYSKEYTGEDPANDPHMPRYQVPTINMCGYIFAQTIDIPTIEDLNEDAIIRKRQEAHVFSSKDDVLTFFGEERPRQASRKFSFSNQYSTNNDCLQHESLPSSEYLPIITKDLDYSDGFSFPVEVTSGFKRPQFQSLLTKFSSSGAFLKLENSGRFKFDIDDKNNYSQKLIISIERIPKKTSRSFRSIRSHVFIPVINVNIPRDDIIESVDFAHWSITSLFKTLVLQIKTDNKVYYVEIQPILLNNARRDNSKRKYKDIVLPLFRGLDPNFDYNFDDPNRALDE